MMTKAIGIALAAAGVFLMVVKRKGGRDSCQTAG